MQQQRRIEKNLIIFNIFKVLRKHNRSPNILYPGKLSLTATAATTITIENRHTKATELHYKTKKKRDFGKKKNKVENYWMKIITQKLIKNCSSKCN